MKRLIGRILALFLATAITASVTLWVLGLTLGSASYLEHTANQTHLYSDIASVVPGSNADVIQSQIQTLLPQFLAFISRGGPAPVIDFGAGPVQLNTPDPLLTSLIKNLGLIGILAPVLVVIIVLLIIVMTGSQRLPILIRSTFESAIGLGLSAGALWLAPGFILNTLSRPDILPFRTPLTPFITQLFHDIALHIAVAAALILAVSLVLRVIHGAIGLKNHFHREPKDPKPPLSPPATTSAPF